MRTRTLAVAMITMCSCVLGSAQTPAPASEPPAFEVASIKPSPPEDPNHISSNIRRSEGGRLTANNVGLKALIAIAYQVRDFQISGGPDWIETARFDISAVPNRKIDFTNPLTDPMPRMLQMLLEERFQLKLRRETKEMPVYALLIAKNGLKLEEAKDANGVNWGFHQGPEGITATNARMADFVNVLARQLDRQVIDKTELTGFFNFTLTFVPERLVTTTSSGDTTAGPSIFTALQ
jgi:uncharacterized protein (TIGR03435 family)